jgi:hypothetical protein
MSETLPSPKAALMVNRIIWAAMILGEVCFMVVLGVIFSQGKEAPTKPEPVLIIADAVLLAVAFLVALFVRVMIFQKARRGQMSAVQAFGTGNILVLAACEGAAFFGLVICLINHSFGPSMWVVAVALALQIVNFPRKSTLDSLAPGLPFA